MKPYEPPTLIYVNWLGHVEEPEPPLSILRPSHETWPAPNSWADELPLSIPATFHDPWSAQDSWADGDDYAHPQIPPAQPPRPQVTPTPSEIIHDSNSASVWASAVPTPVLPSSTGSTETAPRSRRARQRRAQRLREEQGSNWQDTPVWDPDQHQWDPSSEAANYRAAERARAQRNREADPSVPGWKQTNQGSEPPPRTWAELVVRCPPAPPQDEEDLIEREFIGLGPSFMDSMTFHSLRRVRSSFRYTDQHRDNESPSSERSEWEEFPPSRLAVAAEEASLLLELFHKTMPDNDDIGDEHRQMIDNALRGILGIHKELRLQQAQSNGPVEPRLEDIEGTNVDAGCIICYSEIADTVLFPCKHLAICAVWSCS